MANPAVQFYILIGTALGQPLNTAIVDTTTEDYVVGLSPEALSRAVYEVAVLSQSVTVQQWLRGTAIVQRTNLVTDRVATAQTAATAAQMDAVSALNGIGSANAAAAMAQSTATAAASTANMANTAAGNAVTTATAAQTAASAAQASANAAASAATNAQTTANQALAGAGAGANLPRAVIRATNLSAVTVSAGAGTPTLIPFPTGSLRGTPLTQPSADFTLTGGVLRINTPGVYQYDIAAAFTTGLLTVGTVRMQFSVGENLANAGTRVLDADESSTHHVQIAVLSSPAGLNGGGTFQVPAGGRDVALLAGHAALLGVTVTLSELRVSVRRIGNLS